MQALLALAILLDVDPPRSVVKPIEDKVRAILVEGFGDLLSDKLAAAWAPRLALPIARAASENWRALLLKELPDAARYHRRSMEGLELSGAHLPGLPRFQMPKEELAEGVEIELAYLTARVERAARRKSTPEIRKAVESQVDQIMGECAKAVADRLGGGAMPPKTRKHFDGLALAWKASLDMPYNTCLDRPLSEGDLRDVLAGMKAEAAKADIDEGALIEATREAAYRGVGRCFQDFDPFQKKSDAWTAKRKKRYDDFLRANGVDVLTK